VRYSHSLDKNESPESHYLTFQGLLGVARKCMLGKRRISSLTTDPTL
jgi:hypothetical protein